MILLTVGAQMPFDRLVAAADDWAGRRGRTDVFAQVGDTSYEPRHLRWEKFVTPDRLRELVLSAELIVAHAGMGTILTALELGKPIIVLPRRGSLRETRNDHQVATARQFGDRGLVAVAWDEHELGPKLDSELGHLQAADKIPPQASPALCLAVTKFLERPRGGKADGVICFGGVDWWYHNRGHYDIQMMREMSRTMPVLYVNSIGMRTPSLGEGRVLLGRVSRKVNSWMRGLRVVRRNFGVLSPVSVPKFHQTRWAKAMLVEQVRDAATYMGIRHPLIWVACPTAAEVIDRFPAAGMVYQRTDRFEHFPGVNAERIRSQDQHLKRGSDLTLFCSTSVFESEASECSRAAFVDHGVDFDQFASAGDGGAREPQGLRGIGRPRVGFVGGIDAHTFDPELFSQIAAGMPDCSFVLVGGCSLPKDWCQLPNVHLLGRKPYDEVAAYMAACDVLIMPWNRSAWIKACNPVKLKEYLAVGRPVVSTPFDELCRYSAEVAVATDASGFMNKIREALSAPADSHGLRERVRNESWSMKADSVVQNLNEAGVEFRKDLLQPGVAQESKAVSTVKLKKETSAGPEGPCSQGAGDPVLGGRGYWRPSHFLAAIGLMAAGLWVTSDAWLDIFRVANRDEESSHILLAIPAAAWLLWVMKARALEVRRTGTLLGPVFTGVGWLLYSAGDSQLIQTFWYLGAILVTFGCVQSVLGSNILRRFWPVFLVLLFLIPVPGRVRLQIASPMQALTANLTSWILNILGEPVAIHGKVLILNGVSVGIAEACNGLRMIFALGLVCYVFAFSMDFSARARLLLIIASPLVAIAANVARLVPTVLVYAYANEKTAVQFHDWSGLAMMPLVIVGLICVTSAARWIAARARDSQLDRPKTGEPVSAG